MFRQGVVAVALTAATAGTVAAQVKAGAELMVNSYTPGNQYFASVAVNAAGDFVVVWESYPGQDGDLTGVFGQRFDRTGARKGAEFQVNTFTTSYQGNVGHIGLGHDRQGRFAVAWGSFQQDGSGWGVFARRFDANGAPAGAEFQVNTYTAGDEGGEAYATSLALAMNPKGSFVVVWTEYEASGTDIRGQRYDALGVRQGAEFTVNTLAGVAIAPGVAMNARGEFVVAWATHTAEHDWDVAVRRFDAAGAPQGGQFLANTYTTGSQGYGSLFAPSVALADSGAFTIVWNSTSDDQDGSGLGVFGQAFSASGAPVGSEFQANTYTTGSQAFPTANGDANGNVVVTWQSDSQDGASRGIFAQRFNAQGQRRGAEFQVNTFTTGFQGVPGVSLDPVGNFAIAYHSPRDGSGTGVSVQRYGGWLPAALDVDTNANGVLEPGESTDMRPTWRNVNGTNQTFSATLSSPSGPPGGSPTITDGAGDYGTVVDGAAAPCSDCYAVAIPAPPSRPATHWDGSAVESMSPDVQGQQKAWLLHIGASFSDVPTTSLFYRAIEALLHNGVTSGCTPTQYCPAAAATRDQMAVFVLSAREGGGYAPPACTTPVFGDVPASSPFCRFIEELARRGVVSGCGAGNYCPTSPVTREQMAVFTLRTLDPALNPPNCVAGSEVFADVPASSGFCKWIEELARRGVVTGCGGGNYCPAQPVTREQMSVFIGATFGLTLYGV